MNEDFIAKKEPITPSEEEVEPAPNSPDPVWDRLDVLANKVAGIAERVLAQKSDPNKCPGWRSESQVQIMNKYLLIYSGDAYEPLSQIDNWYIHDSIHLAKQAVKNLGVDMALILELNLETNTTKVVWDWDDDPLYPAEELRGLTILEAQQLLVSYNHFEVVEAIKPSGFEMNRVRVVVKDDKITEAEYH